MADEMTCRIVGQLSDVILRLEDQLHELRAMRQMMEERLPKPSRPAVQRNPAERRGKSIRVTEINGDNIHDLGMTEARSKDFA